MTLVDRFLSGRRAKALVGVTLALSLTSALPVAANSATTTPRCNGETATLVGTPGNDVINGTPGRDVIVGLGGNDIIAGLNGNDLICGGTGADRIEGHAGADKIFGGPGADVLIGGEGNDRITGGNGADRISGGSGARDFCFGGRSTDRASGCEGRSSVRPVNLVQIDDPVVRTSLRQLSTFRQNNFSNIDLGFSPATAPASIAPVYITEYHNTIAEDLLEASRLNGQPPVINEGSRIFRRIPSINGIGIIQSICTPVSERPTAAVPGIISASIIGSPDLQFLVTRPQIDRVGISWLETNECLYWSVVLGAPLNAAI